MSTGEIKMACLCLVLLLAPARPAGTGPFTSSGIISIITADTLTTSTGCLSDCRVDRPVEALAVQQAPVLGENKHVLHKSPMAISIRREVHY